VTSISRLLAVLAVFVSFTAMSAHCQISAITSDGRSVFLKSDGTWHYAGVEKAIEEGLPQPAEKSFYWKDGYGNMVEVKFNNLLNDMNVSDDSAVRGCMLGVLSGAKYELKNQLSFVPAELTLLEDDEEITCGLKFRGKNAYGAESETITWRKLPIGALGQEPEYMKQIRLAAEQGEARSQLALSITYARGVSGVPQDLVQAYKWLNLAAAQGLEAAIERKERLRSEMTPEQIAEAEKLSSAWKPVGERVSRNRP
jgi:TPR repeat protein